MIAAITIASVLPRFEISGKRVTKIGDFAVDSRGYLSLNGRQYFSVYLEDGRLSHLFMLYRLVGNKIEAYEIPAWDIIHPS